MLGARLGAAPQDTDAPVPGLADVFWLALYPCVLVAFAALARPWLRRAPRKLALDAATIMLATAALAPPSRSRRRWTTPAA